MIKLYRNLYLHYSTLFVIFCFVLGNNYQAPGLTLISVMLHECGHLIALVSCGGKAERLVIHAFGISINTQTRGLSSRKILLVALGGPALSLILAGLFYFVFPPLFSVNLSIGLINLIPVIPLDGGRAMGVLLTKMFGRKSSRIILHSLCLFVGLIAIPVGVVLFLSSGFNISLLLLGLFIIAESTNTPLPEPPSFVHKKVVLGEIYLLPQNMKLREAADFLPAGSLGAVVSDDGTVVRLVTAKGLYNRLAQFPERD